MKINNLTHLAAFLRQIDPEQGAYMQTQPYSAERAMPTVAIGYEPPAGHKPWHDLQDAYEAGKSKRRGRPKGKHSRNKSGIGKSM